MPAFANCLILATQLSEEAEGKQAYMTACVRIFSTALEGCTHRVALDFTTAYIEIQHVSTHSSSFEVGKGSEIIMRFLNSFMSLNLGLYSGRISKERIPRSDNLS